MICRPVLVWDELVLVKVIKVAKEIRPDDKKRGAAPAVCRAALWSAGGYFCCRRPGVCLPFWVPERQGGRARRLGDGLPGVAVVGNDPAAIWRYLISH